MERVREIADELALLVAQEHRRANDEHAANTRLTTVLSFALAELECEREARERAEAEVRALTTMVLDQRRPLRFSHHSRSRPRRAPAAL